MNKIKIKLYIGIILSIILLCVNGNAIEDQTIIIIDPGHGGINQGIKIINQDEKTLTLKLSHILTKKFPPPYRIVITRSDDYNLSLSARAARANHAGGHVFISLHWGSAQYTSIFYYQNKPKAIFPVNPELDITSETQGLILWKTLQKRHLDASLQLADQIQNRFEHAKISGAPLVVLEGVDMPAVLIECRSLQKSEDMNAFLHTLADKLALSVKTFLLK